MRIIGFSLKTPSRINQDVMRRTTLTPPRGGGGGRERERAQLSRGHRYTVGANQEIKNQHTVQRSATKTAGKS